MFGYFQKVSRGLDQVGYLEGPMSDFEKYLGVFWKFQENTKLCSVVRPSYFE